MTLLILISWAHVLIVLVLASPLLLLSWGLYRLRTTEAGSLPSDRGHATANRSLLQTYLLANYAAAVQASNLRQGKAFPLVAFLVMFEVVQLYTAVYLLLVWRSVSYVVGWGLLAAFALLAYWLVMPRMQQPRTKNSVVAAHEALPAQAQSAWGLLGHTMLWGSFCFIFVCIILREYYL